MDIRANMEEAIVRKFRQEGYREAIKEVGKIPFNFTRKSTFQKLVVRIKEVMWTLSGLLIIADLMNSKVLSF
jgi:hypothetical protein